MKRALLNHLVALAVGLALNLQLSTALAQGSGFNMLAITNPTPGVGGFGISVAAVGTDRLLIGAGGGAAYLFNTSGALLTTFTNPTPTVYNAFGSSVAAVGSDRVLIGAPYDDTGATDAGAAYLFSTDGTLLTTFVNPTPAANYYFGFSGAAVGVDRVVIGAYSGGG